MSHGMKLSTPLATKVLVGSRVYDINADFRVVLRFFELLDSTTDEESVADFTVSLFYPLPPRDKAAAVAALLDFFQGAGESDGGKAAKGAQVLDFVHDSGYIYAAFMEQYGIDLYDTNMHWYKFLALMRGISDSTALGKIMMYRSMDISALKGDTRRFYEKMKRLYALPKKRGDMKRQEKLVEALLEGNISRIKELKYV